MDQSLDRLGVEYVDFLQLHNGPVVEPLELSGRSYTHLWVEDYLRPGGALEGIQRVQRSGKARFIGFITRGNDEPAVRQLIDTGAFGLINASVNLLNPSAAMKPYGMNVDHDWGGILGYAAAHGVGVGIYSPLAGGFLNENAVSGGTKYPRVRPHFGLMSPNPPKQLMPHLWPSWMTRGGQPIWFELTMPAGRRRVMRCDTAGRSNTGGAFFRALKCP